MPDNIYYHESLLLLVSLDLSLGLDLVGLAQGKLALGAKTDSRTVINKRFYDLKSMPGATVSGPRAKNSYARA